MIKFYGLLRLIAVSLRYLSGLIRSLYEPKLLYVLFKVDVRMVADYYGSFTVNLRLYTDIWLKYRRENHTEL